MGNRHWEVGEDEIVRSRAKDSARKIRAELRKAGWDRDEDAIAGRKTKLGVGPRQDSVKVFLYQEEIAAGVEAGMDDAAIGSELGITVGEVHRRRIRFGIYRNRFGATPQKIVMRRDSTSRTVSSRAPLARGR